MHPQHWMGAAQLAAVWVWALRARARPPLPWTAARGGRPPAPCWRACWGAASPAGSRRICVVPCLTASARPTQYAVRLLNPQAWSRTRLRLAQRVPPAASSTHLAVRNRHEALAPQTALRVPLLCLQLPDLEPLSWGLLPLRCALLRGSRVPASQHVAHTCLQERHAQRSSAAAACGRHLLEPWWAIAAVAAI